MKQCEALATQTEWALGVGRCHVGCGVSPETDGRGLKPTSITRTKKTWPKTYQDFSIGGCSRGLNEDFVDEQNFPIFKSGPLPRRANSALNEKVM